VAGVLYQLRDIYSKCRFCFATFGFLKGEDIIFYERDIDEDVNMLFPLKQMVVES
jgi:hypothetical protein